MSSEAEFGTPPGTGTPPAHAPDSGSSTRRGLHTYLIGLGLATAMTIASFWAAQTHLIYGPGISVAIVVPGDFRLAVDHGQPGSQHAPGGANGADAALKTCPWEGACGSMIGCLP